jgi:hypothetical protein
MAASDRPNARPQTTADPASIAATVAPQAIEAQSASPGRSFRKPFDSPISPDRSNIFLPPARRREMVFAISRAGQASNFQNEAPIDVAGN